MAYFDGVSGPAEFRLLVGRLSLEVELRGGGISGWTLRPRTTIEHLHGRNVATVFVIHMHVHVLHSIHVIQSHTYILKFLILGYQWPLGLYFFLGGWVGGGGGGRGWRTCITPSTQG